MTSPPVVVVGAGLAGSAAACRAAQLEHGVLLVDAADDPTAGGNTALSGGGMHLGPRLDPTRDSAQAIREAIVRRTAGEARPELVAAIADNAGRALAWLGEQGAPFVARTEGDLYPRLAPARSLGDVHDWRDKGPQRALRALQDRVRAHGGTVRGATRVVELDRDPGGVVHGVVTEGGDRIAARAVVLADGGFQADPSLRRRHIGPAADQLFLRAAASGRGDALRMGEAAGAQVAHTAWFYGHCLHRGAFTNDRLWPWPGLDEVMADGGVLIDASGRRLIDEMLGGIAVANAVGQSTQTFAWVVISDELWREAHDREVSGHLAANPELERRGGAALRAAAPQSLAELMAVDAAQLELTLDEYSQAANAGRGADLPVPRGGAARPISGDLIAFPMVPGITYTTGGLLIDATCRVLDEHGAAVAGLLAAGAATAGVVGGPNAGYVGGLMTALVTGVLAGEQAAA